MRYRSRSVLVGIAAMVATVASVTTMAVLGLDQWMGNPANWATQAGDYANHRYSTLTQINAGNVGNLQVAWTLSTGVLRGHEGRIGGCAVSAAAQIFAMLPEAPR